jgi:hexulose-6-phosphate isomerase
MTDCESRIGFMQGRLSPQVDGKIQSFPWSNWNAEFAAAERLAIPIMEWTLDHERLSGNPLMTPSGRQEIRKLSDAHGVKVKALTGDLFMQAPFWKADATARATLLAELDGLLDACAEAGIAFVVVPLVDGGRIESKDHAAVLAEGLQQRAEALRARRLAMVFESDFAPDRLAAFIADYPADVFGINYDIGNSASLGYDCGEEIGAYAARIRHVHVKDRVRGGTTVPLGTGNADLPRAIRLIEQSGYRGDYVLQTARAADGDHAGALEKYRDMTISWISGSR